MASRDNVWGPNGLHSKLLQRASAANTQSSHRSARTQPGPNGSTVAPPAAGHDVDSALRAEIEGLKAIISKNEEITRARLCQLEKELDEARRKADAIIEKMDALGADVTNGSDQRVWRPH